MKIKYFFTALIFGILFVACKQEKKEPTTLLLKEYMIGSWETTYLKIKYLTANETDSTVVFEDDFSKPNSGKGQSVYNHDGTFSAWFLQTNGKKVGKTKGKWKTNGDSLFVNYQYLEKQVQAWYNVTQTNAGFSAVSTYDWDDDGEFDDTLLMITKKIQL